MQDDLYERDFLVWSETQAALLRRLEAGERINERVDWPHLIEEVEDLGREQIHACESLLRQAMVHLFKLSTGAERPAAHWRQETVGFLKDARKHWTPSMRPRIDVGTIYRDALDQISAGGEYPGLPSECPWTLDALLEAKAASLETLLAALAADVR